MPTLIFTHLPHPSESLTLLCAGVFDSLSTDFRGCHLRSVTAAYMSNESQHVIPIHILLLFWIICRSQCLSLWNCEIHQSRLNVSYCLYHRVGETLAFQMLLDYNSHYLCPLDTLPVFDESWSPTTSEGPQGPQSYINPRTG